MNSYIRIAVRSSVSEMFPDYISVVDMNSVIVRTTKASGSAKSTEYVYAVLTRSVARVSSCIRLRTRCVRLKTSFAQTYLNVYYTIRQARSVLKLPSRIYDVHVGGSGLKTIERVDGWRRTKWEAIKQSSVPNPRHSAPGASKKLAPFVVHRPLRQKNRYYFSIF